MYQKGQVEWGSEIDTTTEDYDAIEGAYLPHSCEKWVIGGVENIQAMIDDLKAILEARKEGSKS